jgi:hypothetical protein
MAQESRVVDVVFKPLSSVDHSLVLTCRTVCCRK